MHPDWQAMTWYLPQLPSSHSPITTRISSWTGEGTVSSWGHVVHFTSLFTSLFLESFVPIVSGPFCLTSPCCASASKTLHDLLGHLAADFLARGPPAAWLVWGRISPNALLQNSFRNIIVQKLEKSCSEGTQQMQHDWQFCQRVSEKDRYLPLQTAFMLRFSEYAYSCM